MENGKTAALIEIEARRLPPELIASLTAALRLAQGDTGGGRAMARVLLGAYNGHRFPLDLSELGSLDKANFKHALNVIRLRYMGHEPHNFFIDGGDVFERIAADWGFEA